MKMWTKTGIFVLVLALMAGSVFTALGADGKKTLRIVVVPERNIFEQQRKYRRLCDYTCKVLPFKFNFEVLRGYRDVVLALKEGNADGAFMGSFVAAYGIDNYGFVPLVRPVWSSGESHYSSCIFKRADLPVTRDIATWEGKSFVFVGPNTTAGYFFPLSLLRSAGVEVPDEYFSSTRFAGSHDAAVWMVANEMADLGAAKNTVFNEYTRRKPEIGKKVELLYTGGRYPDSTLVVRPEVPREIRESIRDVFLRMASQQEGQEVLKMFGALKFIETSSEEFGEVRQVVMESGYDIRNIGLME